MKQLISDYLRQAGASAYGFAKAEPVHADARRQYEAWLARGYAHGLDYMANNLELRFDPRGLLEGCQTIVSTAWLYNPPQLRDASLPYLARYAYGRDYHKSLRTLLKPLCRELNDRGIATRICVDSAPVMERYWAVKSGVGFCGHNGLLIVPGVGSRVFLAELLITAELPADDSCSMSCNDCGACLKTCPARALTPEGVNCSRCISALTIERPGMALSLPRPTLMGCDVCQDICPHNRANPACKNKELATRPELLTLAEPELTALTDEEFRNKYAGTALMRAGRDGLLANLRTFPPESTLTN